MDTQEEWSAEKSAEIIIRNAWNATQTTEEAIRDFLARDRGAEWRGAQLQTNELFGCIVYTAALTKMLGGRWYTIVYVIDRDAQGQFYLADPSPVAGYE